MAVSQFEMEFASKSLSRPKTKENTRKGRNMSETNTNYIKIEGIYQKELSINAIDFLPQETTDFFSKTEKESTEGFWKTVIIFSLIGLFGTILLSYNSDNQFNQHAKERMEKLEENLQVFNQSLLNLKQEMIALMKNLNETYQQGIRDALDLYDADKIGLIDYALESNGGSIISIPETSPYSPDSGNLISWFSLGKTSNPRILLQSHISPGDCFAFKGQKGRIVIHLFYAIHITSFTLEHAHRSLLIDHTTAPQLFQVFGLDNETKEIVEMLGQFTFNFNKSLENFKLKDGLANRKYQYVELRILSNHGNPMFTCVYRFRVHGHP